MTKKLEDLERKFEECVANEEKKLFENFAKMLTGSTARKLELVQSVVQNLRENAVNKTHELQ